jgi:Domain of unknown function (DUF2017)
VGHYLAERLGHVANVTGTGEGGIRLALEEHEADLLRQLFKEMKLLLEADIPPSDAVIKRLYPDAFDDEQRAQAYRELIGDELQNRKLAALRTAEDLVGEAGAVDAALDEEEVDRLLALVTDIRLAIGTRLDVTEERMAAELQPDDPDVAALSVLHWLGWLQESIIEAIT